jgi:hypothetical protein
MRGLSGLLWVGGAVGAGLLLLRWLIAKGAAEYRTAAEELQQISELSVKDAAVKARALLFDATIFRVVASTSRPAAGLEQLAPKLQNVMAEYESIELPSTRIRSRPCRSARRYRT